ncbi:MAG: hypothetical protein V7695_08425 [Sulfitobacter sp.]
MDKTQLNVVINELETQHDLTVADFETVVQAMHHILPDDVAVGADLAQRLNSTDDAMLIADHAFPNWYVHIRGRTNDKDGHWTCTLREKDGRDSDAYIGTGISPILSQAILAAVMRLGMATHRDDK